MALSPTPQQRWRSRTWALSPDPARLFLRSGLEWRLRSRSVPNFHTRSEILLTRREAMVIRAIATSLVASVLFVILLLRNSMITRTVYKFAFFLGLAAL